MAPVTRQSALPPKPAENKDNSAPGPRNQLGKPEGTVKMQSPTFVYQIRKQGTESLLRNLMLGEGKAEIWCQRGVCLLEREPLVQISQNTLKESFQLGTDAHLLPSP